MPKISEERKQQRRDEILDAARRCFARYGYEGATVARLEEETGLSRGAIFNYFESKDDIFATLAERDNERYQALLAEHGVAALLRALAEDDPDWYASQLEAVRRARTDAAFRERIERRGRELSGSGKAAVKRLRDDGDLRDDVPLEAVGTFLSIVLNGLALRRAVGDEVEDLDGLVRLVDDAVGARPRTPARRPAGPA